MSTKSKTLAKSLHTVSVIVTIARREINNGISDPRDAIISALWILGYSDASDPHGLVARALAVLES